MMKHRSTIALLSGLVLVIAGCTDYSNINPHDPEYDGDYSLEVEWSDAPDTLEVFSEHTVRLFTGADPFDTILVYADSANVLRATISETGIRLYFTAPYEGAVHVKGIRPNLVETVVSDTVCVMNRFAVAGDSSAAIGDSIVLRAASSTAASGPSGLAVAWLRDGVALDTLAPDSALVVTVDEPGVVRFEARLYDDRGNELRLAPFPVTVEGHRPVLQSAMIVGEVAPAGEALQVAVLAADPDSAAVLLTGVCESPSWTGVDSMVRVYAPDTAVLRPAPSDTGLMVIDFWVTDRDGLRSGVVRDSIRVIARPANNHAPIAAADTYKLRGDTLRVPPSEGLLANDTDLDGDPLSAVLLDDARHGAVALEESGAFAYVPADGFAGLDTFTYRARDAWYGFSEETVVSVTVGNAVPVAAADSYSVHIGVLNVPADRGVLANDSDSDGDPLFAVLLDSAKHGAVTLEGSGAFAYEADSGFFGADTFSYRARDTMDAYSDTAVVSVVVGNGTPTSAGERYDVVEDSTFSASAENGVLANDSDPDGDALTAVLVDSTRQGELSLLPDGSFSYAPNADFTGADSFSYAARDSYGAQSPTSVVVLAVSGVNDPPNVYDQSVSLNEDDSLTVTLTAIDPEGDSIMSWEIAADPVHGTLTGARNGWVYTAAPDYAGVDTFTFRAYDGVLWSDTGTIALRVNPVNDPPRWKQATEDVTVKEGVTVTVDLAALFDSDPEGDGVTFAKESGRGTITGSRWEWLPDYTAARPEEYTVVLSATDDGSPARSADLTLAVTVLDSLCRLTVTVRGEGEVEVVPEGTAFDPTATVQLTAKPDEGRAYAFNQWQGDIGAGARFDKTVSVTMSRDRSILAVFVPEKEELVFNDGCSDMLVTETHLFLWVNATPPTLVGLRQDSLSSQVSYRLPDGAVLDGNLAYCSTTNSIYGFIDGDLYVFDADDIAAGPEVAEMPDVTMPAHIVVDNTDLYVADNHVERSFGEHFYHSRVIKYALDPLTTTPSSSSPLDSSKALKGIVVADGNVFASLGAYDASQPYARWQLIYFTKPWMAAYNAADLAFVDSAEIAPKNPWYTEPDSLPGELPRDFVAEQGYLWVGAHAGAENPHNGSVFKIDQNDLSSQTIVATVTRFDGGYCNGLWASGGRIWAGYRSATAQASAITVSGLSQTVATYALDYANPVKIRESNRRLFMLYTDWSAGSSVLQAIDPGSMSPAY